LVALYFHTGLCFSVLRPYLYVMGVPIREFLYFITNGSNKTARVDSDGTVRMLGGAPVPLPQSPDGWRSFELGFATDRKYFSLNRSATVPTLFVNEAASIIRHYMYSGAGYNSDLYLLILRRNPATGIYTLEYNGKLDIVNAKDDPQRGVTVNAKQGGPMSFIEANEGVVYEMGNLPSFDLLFDGMTFQNKLTYIYGTEETSTLDLNNGTFTLFPLVFKQQEGVSFDLVNSDSVIDEAFASQSTFLPTSADYLIYRPFPTTVTTGGTIRFEAQSSLPQPIISIYFITSKTLTEYDILRNYEVPGFTIIDQAIPAYDIELEADERLFLVVKRENSFGVLGIYNGTEVTLLINTKAQPTTNLLYSGLEVGKEIVKRMTGGVCTFRSLYLESVEEGNRVDLTSGQSLRNRPAPVLKTSFEDYFAFYDSIRPMALKLDGNTIFMEPVEDLYGAGAEIFDVGEISDVTVEFAASEIANTAVMGYPTRNREEVNGIPEYNGISTFQLPVTVIRREYKKVGKYVTAPSDIERFRRADTALANDDRDDIDNTVFGISTAVVEGQRVLRRDTYTTIVGVVDPTDAYNIEPFTPARMLRAHGPIVGAIIEQQGNAPITWVSSDRNTQLATTGGSRTISERGLTYPGQLQAAIMRMFDLSFTVPSPSTFAEALVAVNRGNIRAEYLGNEIFLLPIGEMKSRPGDSEPQEWKLRLSTSTPISSLLSLSLEGIFSIDSVNNTIFISDLNPLHFSKFGYVPAAPYHNLEIYDAPFVDRNTRQYNQPHYEQKWQKNDEVLLQCITSGYSALTAKVFSFSQLETILENSSDAATFAALVATITPISLQTLDIVADPAVLMPYALQQASFDLSLLTDDYYLVMIYDGTTPLFISEWLWVREDWPLTFRFDYFHSTNKYNCYWTNFKPCIRVEANFMPILPQADSTEYVDELKNDETIDGRPWDKRVLLIGDGSGVPDWMARKINMIMLLNRTSIEGVRYSRSGNSVMEPVIREGYPMHYYQLEVQPAQVTNGLVFTGTPAPANDTFVATLDASAFGLGEGVLDIDVENDP
jgi:hypothetical protein